VLSTISRFVTFRERSKAVETRTFASLPPGTQGIILVTTLGAIGGLLWQAPSAHVDNAWTFVGLLLASVALAASKVPLPLLPSSATLSLSYCTNFAALALLPPFESTLVVGAGAWSQCVLNSSGQAPAYRTVFSVATVVVSAQVAGLCAAAAGGYDLSSAVGMTAPTLAAATAFFLVNSSLVAFAVAQSSGTSPWGLWHEQFLWSAPVCFLAAAVGSAVAYLMGTTHSGIAFLAVPPLFLVYLGYKSYLQRVDDQQRHLEEVSALHLASVEALARAIGARDQTLESSRMASDTHVRRVQLLARALARAAGISEQETKGVEVAALLHDIGKLAVPEHILTKPGRLTEQEFEAIRLHPTIGAEIIRAVPFPYPVASLIESHHERWNGTGYPVGLAGEAIPLGARILGIVDYFDALIADRPYHKAISEAEAVAIIQGEAGKALDPTLVGMFVKIIAEQPSLQTSTPGIDRSPAAPPRLGHPATGLASTEPSSQESVKNALENITRANQEMRALYDVAEAMGTRLGVADTMALLAGKLTPLVPASSWALFLHDATTGRSRCEFATGLDSNLLLKVDVPLGVGAIGWMARRPEALVNARPAVDFEAAHVKDQSSLRSMIAFPLMFQKRFIGALAAYHVDKDHFDANHERILERVSAQAAKVVQDAQAFEQVRQDSLTDPLTGVSNARAFLSHVEREIDKANRQHTPRALLVIDVDRFKSINDRFGHDVGDRALKAIAQAIRGAVRSYDFCARNGGDEFVVLLAECDATLALERAAAIQRAVATTEFEAEPGVAVPLGISIGYATYPEDGLTYEPLLKKADRRMYSNKSSRRAAIPAASPVPVGVPVER
jgi:diguanylate cyclase (GGDEF)-like protein/putative nucleotidyltransferase with HDIG domain